MYGFLPLSAVNSDEAAVIGSLRLKFSAYRHGLTRQLVALGVVVVVVGLGILAMVVQAGRSGDTVAIQRASFVIATGIDAFVNQSSREHVAAWEAAAVAGTSSPEAGARILLTAYRHMIVLLDGMEGRILAAENVLPADLSAAVAAVEPFRAAAMERKAGLRTFAPSVLGSTETQVTARLLAFNGHPAVAIHSYRPESGASLTTLRLFDEGFLISLTRDYAVDEPHFAMSGDVAWPATAKRLVGDAGETIGYFVWSPKRAGTDILKRLLPIFVPGLLMLFVLTGWLILGAAKRNTDFATSEAHARFLSLHDELTGLPNRRAFTKEMERAVSQLEAERIPVHFALIDVDHFKDVNDTLGHHAGDELVIAVGNRIRSAIGNQGMVARLGGDEFAVLVSGRLSVGRVRELVARVSGTFAAPFDLGGQTVYATASAGVVSAVEPGLDGTTIVRRADVALNRAKSEGRARAVVFTEDMDDAVQLRRNLEIDLRSAIETNALEVHYQPIMNHTGRQIVGAEALVRWPHPKQGMISPVVFVPVAEESGAIVALGAWVIRRVFEDAAKLPCFLLSINLSPVQFRAPEFVSMVSDLVKATGVDPRQIEFEITETMLIRDHDRAGRALAELRAMGFRIALDDFGTGYSSLSYLRQFRVEKIKIDQSFVGSIESSPEAAKIVHAIVGLARALGMIVTAEGVETHDQHRFLQAAGCDLLQGYLFARPVQISKLVDLMQEKQSKSLAA